MLDKVMQERFEAALKANALHSLAMSLHTQGHSQVVIYDLFWSFWVILGATEREAAEDIVGDALDYISGWCSPDALWFGQPLDAEELRWYRRTKERGG